MGYRIGALLSHARRPHGYLKIPACGSRPPIVSIGKRFGKNM